MSARAVVAALATLPWAGFALLRGLELDAGGHPWVSLVALTPYAALSSPLPVLLALVLRRPAVAVVAAVVASGLLVAVVPRAFGSAEPRDGTRALTVLSANLFKGEADVEEVLRLARTARADVLSLHELTPAALRRLDAAGGRSAYPRRIRDAKESALLVRDGVRWLPEDAEPDDLSAEAGVALPGGPIVRFVAVHPEPPVTDAKVSAWRDALRALPAAGDGQPLRVLAGDFNATLDHGELRRLLDRGYADAAEAVGKGLAPTWPVGRRLPPIAIDHVLADRRIGVRRFSTHEIAGTDHRAVVAELAVP